MMSSNRNTTMATGQVSARKVESTVLRPVLLWAGLGTLFVLLQGYVLFSWAFSTAFASMGTGLDTLPQQIKVSAWITQFNAIVICTGCIVYCVRKSRREGHMTWDSLLIIGGFSVCWLDTAINYFRPIVLYNAYMLNRGSWSGFIPGWASTTAATPEPLFFVIGLYGWWFVLFSMAFCGFVRWLERRWPGAGLLRLVLAGFVLLTLLDALLELMFVFSGLYAYKAIIPAGTLWVGQVYQFPLYGPVIIGVLCSVVALLRYQAQKHGYSFIEHGVDELSATPSLRTVLRVLAMVGFINTVFLVAVVIHWGIGFHATDTTTFPSYLTWLPALRSSLVLTLGIA